MLNETQMGEQGNTESVTLDAYISKHLALEAKINALDQYTDLGNQYKILCMAFHPSCYAKMSSFREEATAFLHSRNSFCEDNFSFHEASVSAQLYMV